MHSSVRGLVRCGVVLLCSLGRAAPQPGSVTIDVKVEQVSEHVETWRSTFGFWVEREARNARAAEARIKYTTSTPEKPVAAHVEFYFIGQRESASPALELYHYHRRDVSLAPNVSTGIATLTPTIVLKRMHGKELDQRDTLIGVRPFGWVVRVRADNQTLAVASSTPEMARNLENVLKKTGSEKLAELQKKAEKRIKAKPE